MSFWAKNHPFKRLLRALPSSFSVLPSSLSALLGTPQERFFRVISTDEIIAVRGIARIMPMLDESPLIVSTAINDVEYMW